MRFGLPQQGRSVCGASILADAVSDLWITPESATELMCSPIDGLVALLTGIGWLSLLSELGSDADRGVFDQPSSLDESGFIQVDIFAGSKGIDRNVSAVVCFSGQSRPVLVRSRFRSRPCAEWKNSKQPWERFSKHEISLLGRPARLPHSKAIRVPILNNSLAGQKITRSHPPGTSRRGRCQLQFRHPHGGQGSAEEQPERRRGSPDGRAGPGAPGPARVLSSRRPPTLADTGFSARGAGAKQRRRLSSCGRSLTGFRRGHGTLPRLLRVCSKYA